VITVRDLGPDDVGFLREMLYVALAWRPSVELPPLESVLEHPQVAIFHRGWGREGDRGVVAESEGSRVGAAWYRFFTEAEHGEGYVDDETPEVAVAVVDGYRGRGIGRSLLEELHRRARDDGVARISLSVDAENPAKRLYERLGYTEVFLNDELGRMVVNLGGDSGQATMR